MRTAIWIVVLAAALGSQTPARPDFSGTWIVVREGQRSGSSSTPEKHVIIRQTENDLVIDGTGWPGKLVYNLKGIETAVMPTDDRTTSKAKTHWDGATLIVQTIRTIRSRSDTRTTYHFTDSFRLDPSGRLMFERLTKTDRGESVAKVVYRKIGP